MLRINAIQIYRCPTFNLNGLYEVSNDATTLMKYTSPYSKTIQHNSATPMLCGWQLISGDYFELFMTTSKRRSLKHSQVLPPVDPQ